MDLTHEQIYKEFERHVRLCSGLGKETMQEILDRQFNEPRKHKWSFYMNGTFCERCGASIGSGGECRT